MQPKFLVGTVGTDLLIKSDESCRDLVDEAKNYLLLPQDRSSMQGPRTRPRKPIKCGEVLFAGNVFFSPFETPRIVTIERRQLLKRQNFSDTINIVSTKSDKSSIHPCKEL